MSRRHPPSWAAGLLFMFLLAALPARAQITPEAPSQVVGSASLARNSSITGRVSTPSGRPPNSPAKVTLRTVRAVVLTTFTDNNGEYRFLNLAKDSYCLDVVADANFFKPTTECVQMEREPSIIQLNIYLKPKEAAATATEKKEGGSVVSVAELNQKVPAPARQAYEKAAKLIGKGETEEAIRQLRQALALYPEYLSALNDLGLQYKKLRRLDEASEQFKSALAVNEQAFGPRLNLGIMLVEQNNYREAREHLSRALKVDSANPSAHLYLGIAALGTDELPEAHEELSKALILGDAQYAIAHYYLAFVHLKRGERAEALRELNSYLTASPDGELAQHARAMAEKLQRN